MKESWWKIIYAHNNWGISRTTKCLDDIVVFTQAMFKNTAIERAKEHLTKLQRRDYYLADVIELRDSEVFDV